MNRFLRDHYKRIAGMAVGFILLYVTIVVFLTVNRLPDFSAIFSKLRVWLSDGTLFHDVAVTGSRWVIGWSIGSVVGLAVGLFTGRFRLVSVVLEKPLVLLRAIPTIALVPLALRLTGLSELGKIGICAWSSACLVWIIIHHAAEALDPILEWRAENFQIPRVKRLFLIILPTISDSITSAFRSSLSVALVVLAVAEMTGVYDRSSGLWWSEGLGYRLNRSRELGDDPALLATVSIFAFVALSGDQLFVCFWSLIALQIRKLRSRSVKRLMSSLADCSPGKVDWGSASEVSVIGLSATYRDRNIFEGVDMTIPAGQTLALLGLSGSGKTTLVKALAGFEQLDLAVDGSVLTQNKLQDRDRPRVGILFQDFQVFPHLTVWDNLMIIGRFSDSSSASFGEAYYLLKAFGLEAFADRTASTLSGGQRQRLAFAVVLANRPSFLLLDECFGSLDSITRADMQQFYWSEIHGKVTTLFVTHDVTEALKLGDLVRVGVQDGQTRPIPPHDAFLDQWENEPAFLSIRRWASSRLRATSQTKTLDAK